LKSRSTVRVRYAETDQMGVVYHSNFLVYFEIGRTDYFRKFGFTYRQMESEHVYMPVTESYCKHYASAEYDDELEIFTSLEMLSRLKLKFLYEVIRKKDERKMAEGFTIHVPVNSEGKPCRIPAGYLQALRSEQEATRG
jgi:acyl-CoA thioester hydrolase